MEEEEGMSQLIILHINNFALTTFIDSKRKKCLKSCHVRSRCSNQRKHVEHLHPGKYYPQRGIILSG